MRLMLLHIPLRVQRRDVWTIYFIPAEGVEIDAQGVYVHVPVWGQGDAVDAEECHGAAGVDEGGEGADGVDCAEDVGGVGAGDESGGWGEEGEEVGWCEGEVGGLGSRWGGGWPPLDGDVGVVFCQAHPRGEVRFVVETGEDDFAAWREGREDLREIGEELGCAWADDCGGEREKGKSASGLEACLFVESDCGGIDAPGIETRTAIGRTRDERTNFVRVCAYEICCGFQSLPLYFGRLLGHIVRCPQLYIGLFEVVLDSASFRGSQDQRTFAIEIIVFERHGMHEG